eukprot:1389821-Pyramimonas_sp.AAC.1
MSTSPPILSSSSSPAGLVRELSALDSLSDAVPWMIADIAASRNRCMRLEMPAKPSLLSANCVSEL